MGECIFENGLSPIDDRAIADICEKHAGKNFAQLIRVIYQLEIEVAELGDLYQDAEKERSQLLKLLYSNVAAQAVRVEILKETLAKLARDGELSEPLETNRSQLITKTEALILSHQWDEDGYNRFAAMMDGIENNRE